MILLTLVKICMFSCMMRTMFVLHLFFDGICFFWMCVFVDCDDLAMNGAFPLEDFNRHVAVSLVACL